MKSEKILQLNNKLNFHASTNKIVYLDTNTSKEPSQTSIFLQSHRTAQQNNYNNSNIPGSSSAQSNTIELLPRQYPSRQSMPELPKDLHDIQQVREYLQSRKQDLLQLLQSLHARKTKLSEEAEMWKHREEQLAKNVQRVLGPNVGGVTQNISHNSNSSSMMSTITLGAKKNNYMAGGGVKSVEEFINLALGQHALAEANRFLQNTSC